MSSSSNSSSYPGEIRAPYNGAKAILVDGKCYVLQEITYGEITHLAVDEEFDTCEDCEDKLIESSEGNPEIPKYPEISSSSISSSLPSESEHVCPVPSSSSTSSSPEEHCTSSEAPSYEPSSSAASSS